MRKFLLPLTVAAALAVGLLFPAPAEARPVRFGVSFGSGYGGYGNYGGGYGQGYSNYGGGYGRGYSNYGYAPYDSYSSYRGVYASPYTYGPGVYGSGYAPYQPYVAPYSPGLSIQFSTGGYAPRYGYGGYPYSIYR